MPGDSSPRRPEAGPSSLPGADQDSSGEPPAPAPPSPPGETVSSDHSPQTPPQAEDTDAGLQATGEFYIHYPNLLLPPLSTRAANRMGRVMPITRHTLTVPDNTEEHPGGSSSHTLTVPGNHTEDHQGGASGHTLTVPGNEIEDHQRGSSSHTHTVPDKNENEDDQPALSRDDEPVRPRHRTAQGNNENEHDQAPSSRPAGMAQRPGQVPRSRTTYINPLAMHPPNVVASTTMPLTARPGNVETSHPETRPTRPLDPDEINQKIQEMFAATAKLKPQDNQANSRRIPASKTSMFSKPKGMLKRVTTAVGGRFLGSSHSKEQSNNPQHEPLQESEASGVPMIERRLNEGANLNRKKVQHLTGGKVKRKPVPGQQMSTKKQDLAEEDSTEEELTENEKMSAGEPRGRTRFREEPQRHQQSMEDPFSGPSSTDRPRPEFERRLRASSRTSHATPQPQQDDPFAEEGILQSDTNSPLDIAPESASTPRVPGARTVREPSESPTRRAPRAPRGPGGDADPTINGGPGWI